MSSNRPAFRRTSEKEAERVLGVLLDKGPRELYCLKGSKSGELLTREGRLLVHDNPHELELLIRGAVPIPVPPSAIAGRTNPLTDYLVLAAHEQAAGLIWPLDPGEFRTHGDGNPTRADVAAHTVNQHP